VPEHATGSPAACGPTFLWDHLHVERIGDQLHVWGIYEPLDEDSCRITWCHLSNPATSFMPTAIHVVGPGDDVNPDALLVIHTGEVHA
jgi:hypothetical protein